VDPSVAAPARTNRLRSQLRAVISGLAGREYALLTVGVGIVILQLLRSSRSILLPLWGAELSLSATVIGSVMSAGAILDLILFVPSGIIMDRAGRKVAAGLCIGVFSTGVLVLGFTSGVPGFVLASLIIGLGNGFGAGINMTIGTDLAPDGAVSEFIGLWRLFGDVGTTAGPAVIGALAGAGGLGLAITVAALVGYAGLGALLAGPETLHIARRSSIAPD
jgi:MFS family permease